MIWVDIDHQGVELTAIFEFCGQGAIEIDLLGCVATHSDAFFVYIELNEVGGAGGHFERVVDHGGGLV